MSITVLAYFKETSLDGSNPCDNKKKCRKINNRFCVKDCRGAERSGGMEPRKAGYKCFSRRSLAVEKAAPSLFPKTANRSTGLTSGPI